MRAGIASLSRGIARRALRALCLAVFVAAGFAGCSSGGGEDAESGPGKTKREKKVQKSDVPEKPDTPAEKAEPAEKAPPEEALPPAEEPEPEQVRIGLVYGFEDGSRTAYQVRFDLTEKRGEEIVNRLLIDCARFYRCAGVSDEGFRFTLQAADPIEEIVGGRPVEGSGPPWAEFFTLSRKGLHLSTVPRRRNKTLLGMAHPVLPDEDVGPGAEWSLERDFDDGRYLFRYRVEKETELEGLKVLELALTVEVPPGAPCDDLRVENGSARIWFDPASGMTVKAEGALWIVRGEGEDAVVSQGTLSVSLMGSGPMDPREAVDAKKAWETYFGVLDMIERKRYSGAEKAILEFQEECEATAYSEPVYALLKRIPDTRSLQPTGLLDRKRFDFLGLPWNPKPAPPIYGNRRAGQAEGKPRPLALVGQKLPEFWWKGLLAGGKWDEVSKDLQGKILVIHVWASWVPICSETVVSVPGLTDKFKDRGVRYLGITIDTENKRLQEFQKKQKLEHPTVWDADNEAVKKYGLMGVPAFLVVDGKGMVRFGEMGYFGQSTLDRIEEGIKACGK